LFASFFASFLPFPPSFWIAASKCCKHGRKEGRKGGREEGRKEGRKGGMKEGREE
jgi:hypothetical protein